MTLPQHTPRCASPLLIRLLVTLLLATSALLCKADEQTLALKHGVAMHGAPKYSADFKHFDYVNPSAPKGGQIKLDASGTYDSFNPYIPKGVSAAGLGYLFGTLTVSSPDEPFTQYGYIAQHIEMPEDRRWVIFHINPNAVFHDGHPITASDVVFSFNIRLEHGQPSFQHYYSGVDSVTALDAQRVKFTFKESTNRELPLIVGQLAVLPEHDWQKKDFSKSTLEPPLGSGPYKIKAFEAGKYVTYERIKNHWSETLPIHVGRYNIEQITYDYYLDPTVSLEAFKAGQYDFKAEYNSKFWATLYNGPQFERREIVKESLKHNRSAGMQGFIFNIRKPLFQDKVLRQAMIFAFDFEWSNKNLFYGQYVRTRSYFQNTELAATGVPSEAELALLAPFRKQLPDEVFTTEYTPPSTDGSGRARQNLRLAMRLLKKHGYTIRENRLYTPDNTPVEFEFLIYDSAWERIVLPYKKNLEVLGIGVNVRRVDITQYIERRRKFDFDMIVHSWNQTLSPGNEMRSYWHSSSAQTPDSLNLIGVNNPVVDALVEQIISAEDRETLVLRSRAMDRVLQWQYYTVPNWHVNYDRVAYNKKLVRPTRVPRYGFDFDSWWIKQP